MAAHIEGNGKSQRLVAMGIDGCPAGWTAVNLAQQWIRIVPTLQELWQMVEKHLQVALIDIPIGLPDAGYRLCDQEARHLLGSRRSSVFFTPCREAVYSGTYQDANAVNRLRVGKNLSIQAWNICHKIREMDTLLQEHPVREVFLESHPELVFAGLNAGQPLVSKKQRIEGRLERLDLLESFIPGSRPWLLETITAVPNRVACPDDILDAAVLSVAAAQVGAELLPLPNPGPLDAQGVPMQIWVPQTVGAT